MAFEVNRRNFRETRAVATAPQTLEPGQIRLTLERFAVTTNNVTYAVAGDMLNYWGFFPVDEQWGRVPVMGLATVTESANPDIATGGRWFGFYPMAAESIITADVRGDGFRDVGPHRSDHASVYTDFTAVEGTDIFRPAQVDEYLLLWGMFMTSFLIDDQLADPEAPGGAFHGAAQTLVSSASSKTSISLASCLARRDGHRSIGVTSERNRAFVAGLGLYDQVITYDEVDQLDASVASVFVDMAGNAGVRASVHTHFGDQLQASVAVGATHWDAEPDATPLPGPTPSFFFAPAQSAKRSADWGPAELSRRIAESFHALLDTTHNWLEVEHRTGPDGIASVWAELVDGQARPSQGFICAFDPSSFG